MFYSNDLTLSVTSADQNVFVGMFNIGCVCL